MKRFTGTLPVDRDQEHGAAGDEAASPDHALHEAARRRFRLREDVGEAVSQLPAVGKIGSAHDGPAVPQGQEIVPAVQAQAPVAAQLQQLQEVRFTGEAQKVGLEAVVAAVVQAHVAAQLPGLIADDRQ